MRKLGTSERKYRQLIEGSTQGILIHRDWRPLYANQALAFLLGFDDPEDVLAQNSLQHLFASYERKRVHTHERTALGDELLAKYETHAVRL